MAIDVAEDRKRRAIREYFSERGQLLPWVLAGAGLLVLSFSWIGLLLIGFGVYLLVRKRRLTSDAQIDRWTDEDFDAHDYVARARDLAQLGDLVRDSVLLRGVADAGFDDGVINASRMGKDGRMRSTPITATVILCTADQLGIYRTGVDLTTGNRVNERVLEVFYQDVVAIGTDAVTVTGNVDAANAVGSIGLATLTERDKRRGFSKTKLIRNVHRLADRFRSELIAGMLQRDMRKVYRIGLSDGETVRIPIADGRPTRRANSEVDVEVGDEAAKAMVALRAFVREKKRAVLRADPAGSGPLI